MSLDRIEAMRAFCRIAELGSFTAAADSLGLAGTTVSGQIQALERLLKVKLLHRSTRKVHLTSDGLAYYRRAQKVVDDVDDLETSISANRGIARGRVVIEMPSPVGINLVIPALGDFKDKFPEISLEIGCSERAVGLIEEGVDCAIRGGEIADQDLVAHLIGQMRFCLCASPSYLQKSLPITHPSDLGVHQHLGFKFPGTSKVFSTRLGKAHEYYDLSFPKQLIFNNGSAVTAAVVAGLGIAPLPRAEVERLLVSGDLIEILDEWKIRSMPMSIIYPPNHQLSQRVQAIVKWVAQLFSMNDLWRLNDE